MQVENRGFTRYEQTNIVVQVAVTTRVEVTMRVGAATESVQVTAESSLLKTEDGEVSFTVTGKQINELPINFGIGAGAIRNPLSFAQLVPGASINGWNNITINGANGGFKILYEGQESSSSLDPRVSDESQPSVESIQEFTLQTSNFAAEYGTVGSGLSTSPRRAAPTNITAAPTITCRIRPSMPGLPFTDDGQGKHVKIVKHLSNGGFSVGGPVWIPKVYNGKNKTFFFFNWEKYRDRESLYNGITTVPNSALASGDFSSILGRNLATDSPGGRFCKTPSTIPRPDSRCRRTAGAAGVPRQYHSPEPDRPYVRENPEPDSQAQISDSLVNNFAAGGPFYKLHADSLDQDRP